jgi:hypothetical protein
MQTAAPVNKPHASTATNSSVALFLHGVHSVVPRTQVGKHESVARHSFSHLDQQVVLEHRACVYKGVKFSVLAARVDV